MKIKNVGGIGDMNSQIQITCLEYLIIVPCSLKGIEVAEQFLELMQEILDGDVKSNP